MAYLENASKSTGRKGLNPGQLPPGLNCKAGGHLPLVLQKELGQRV